MNSSKVKFSIIIPFQSVSSFLKETLFHINQLTFKKKFEVILLPDKKINFTYKNYRYGIKIIPTGNVSPAIKRDIGAQYAKGEFLAFIDDDAYPNPDWLDVAYNIFSRKDVSAIGGPAITPPSDPLWAKVSGAVFLSRFSGGFPERYWPIPPEKFVDDWPSVNFIVRKDVFDEIGGFKSEYWPGEDTFFCREIIKRNGKILYSPKLVVWHHRRATFGKHLRQIGNYALHRGFFARKFPENSRKLKFFLPSIWALSSLFSLFFVNNIKTFPFLLYFIYSVNLMLAINDIRKKVGWKISLLSPLYIIPTHYWYGLKFIQGFLTRNLKSHLGR